MFCLTRDGQMSNDVRDVMTAHHVSSSPVEIALLWAVHQSLEPCPVCHERRELWDSLNATWCLEILTRWLKDPQHDALRARGDWKWLAVSEAQARLFAARDLPL